jgi:RNA polymerase primary sigma factor
VSVEAGELHRARRAVLGYAAFWVGQAMQQLVAELTRPAVLSDRALRQLARVKDAHQRALQETGRHLGRAELLARTS